ncbi:BBP7 family outer membrane beta-barrel protein [Bradyrhizobium sp. GCM10023182]|uniref:BBP7 family outer membrane beta-barrel protein n=1 Tax=Bradyrhizobium zhengyangense TaxID=2911009 RepID=A0ABS9LPF4_9BRAD|nr:BBP7 family outer membrane beta-barrel protein [Bradyrhizobium zhengyangense]MCG2641180.1 BBP7 family outer membrane beta-barrel protein [Bradyrhizobium zhengyangense]MCG2668896.1 BBP7 family outer membrane beta-barrel protein [Bradyrhizobium zhengyangense]
MNRRAVAVGVAFAAIVLGSGAFAADLPLKAPPKAVDFNPFWAEADYLAWSVTGDKLPALVTTAPVGTPLGTAGVLGQPTTTVLFGNSSVNNDWRSGGRITAGYWFDPQRRSGVEASFFGLENASTGFAANSGATPILTQPFTNALTGLPDALIASFPGVFTGSVNANETSHLLGAGALYRQEFGAWNGQRISALIGYRYLRASDTLWITGTSTSLAFGDFTSTDNFKAASNFHGLDLGLAGDWRNGPWSLEWRGKVALGANLNTADVAGSTISTIAAVTTTVPGGFLALASNSGHFSQTKFAAVPELSLKAGYEIAPAWRLTVGYDVLYWTGVQRAGGLIDTTINPNLIPPGPPAGPTRPLPVMNTTNLLAQGFSVGVRYNY